MGSLLCTKEFWNLMSLTLYFLFFWLKAPGEARGTRRKYLADEFGDPKRWSFAVDYGLGRSGPLNTSYNFCLEVQENSKVEFFKQDSFSRFKTRYRVNN